MTKLSDRELNDIIYSIVHVDPADIESYRKVWRACEERMTGGPMLSDEEIAMIAERLWLKHSYTERTDDGGYETIGTYGFERAIKDAISEARSGMFTEDDIAKAFEAGAKSWDTADHETDFCVYLFTEWIEQYKKERDQ